MTVDVLDAAGSSFTRIIARRRRRTVAAAALALALCVILGIIAMTKGAVEIPLARAFEILWQAMFDPGAATQDRDALVMTGIRLPRVLLGFEVGAALAISGALMQGLFRNPLADPGLIGVSSGAGLAAAATIVLGDRFLGLSAGRLPFALLPVGAFFGGLIATLIIYAVATRQGRTSMATLLLAGIALGAFAGALTGLLAYVSNDQQLRDLSFWSLGSLNGATWQKTMTVAAMVFPLALVLPLLGRGLNAISFGEAEAFHLGIRVERLKAAAIALVALAVGASVASAGMIGFIGIVAPHVVRLTVGPDHRALIPLSAFLGAALLVGADTLARTLAAPAELPVGILTAAIGAPFFLWLLLRRHGGGFLS